MKQKRYSWIATIITFTVFLLVTLLPLTNTAEAQINYDLSVNVEGEGSVSSEPAGIDCSGDDGDDCEAAFDYGTTITLTAEAATGWAFTGWEGDHCQDSSDVECEFTIEANSEVTATFAIISYELFLPVVLTPAEWVAVGSISFENPVNVFYDVAVCNDVYIGGTDDGIYWLNETENVWEKQDSISAITLKVAFIDSNCEWVYAATLDEGLRLGYYEGNGNWSWYAVNNSGPNGDRIRSVAIRNETVFIAGDFGIRWATLPEDLLIDKTHVWNDTGVTNLVTSLTQSTGSEIIYASVWLDGVYVNVSGNNSLWEKQGNLPDNLVYESSGRADGIARLAGTQERLFLWNGTQWIPTANNFINTTFAVAATDTALYAGQRDVGVIVSYNGGQSWMQMMDGLAVPPSSQFQVRGFFLSEEFLYAATTNGVWRWPLP